MDKPRNLFVFAGVFLVLALLPVIPVVNMAETLEPPPKVVFISYIQVVKIIFVVDQQYRFEGSTLVALAALLVVGIIVSILILQRLDKKR